MSKHARIFVALALGAALLLPWLLGGEEVTQAIHLLTLQQVLFLVVPVLLVFFLNVLRVWVLLPARYDRLTFFSFFRIFASCEFFAKTTPGGAGAFAAALVLVKPYGVPPAVVIGTFSISTVQDMAIISLLAGASLAAKSEGLWAEHGLIYVLVMIAAVGGLSLVRLARGVQLPSKFADRYPWLHGKLRALIGGLRAIKRSIISTGLLRFFLSSILALSYWLTHLSILYWVIRVIGGDIDWAYAALLQLAVIGAGHLSLSPGGAGVVEAGAMAGLAPFVSLAEAAFIVIVWRLSTQYFYVFFGGMAFLLERIIISRRKFSKG